jgi:hypothetical protein
MSTEDQKMFTLTEAERTRSTLEPILLEAMEARRRMTSLESKLHALAERIQRMGGILVSYERIAKVRIERDTLGKAVEAAMERMEATGCVVKDLDVGLLDFPARLNNQDVYLCWRVGEDRIRFYHRQDEGFSGRKPIDPRDLGQGSSVQ